jgi:hypothetical protein
MFKFFKPLYLSAFALLIVSCVQNNHSTSRDEFLAKLRDYSDVEPKGNQPKSRLTVIQIGESDFYAPGLKVYDQENKDEKGRLNSFRFGDSYYADKVLDIQDVVVPSDDFVESLNQINIVPKKPFIFRVWLSKSKRVEPGWFSSGYTESVTCKWSYKKFFFIPEANKDYLLSIGAKRTDDEKKFLCVFKIEEWNKKTKQYQKVPFMLYPEK